MKKNSCKKCGNEEFKQFYNVELREIGYFCLECGEEYPYYRC